MSKNQFSPKPDWIKISALLVSALALILSFVFGYQSRKHNELSFQPYLDIFWGFTPGDKASGIYVENGGGGPAIIHWMSIEWQNGENIVLSHDWGPIYNALHIKNTQDTKTTLFRKGNLIKSGRSPITLFGVTLHSDESVSLEEALKSEFIDVTICYESIHEHFFQSNLLGFRKAVDDCIMPPTETQTRLFSKM